ncbi:PHD and RING finger domain-containing protein 1 isoform X2 [Amia ocellicauda]|uniref:PHD and RING finger domain-containing protein 1 isoform X2 n=1 Tax=Amia ocellicauda TaxID=2972642 RepID=UPI003463C3B5
MDDEDSQDELINRNASLGKGKRQSLSVLSDEEEYSDEEGEESEEEETDSEEEEGEEEDDDGEIIDEEEEDDSDEAEDDDAEKQLGGTPGGAASSMLDLSSDEDSEKCPICLNTFQEQAVGTPENCEHFFCLDCILEWSNNANSCPVDRKEYNNICLRSCYGGTIQKKISVQKPNKNKEEEVEDQTNCEVCGRSDREDRLLLCDGCDAGYHMECLNPPLDAVPVEEWFCPECVANQPARAASAEEVSEEEVAALMADAVPTTSRLRNTTGPTRAIARTQQSERVRANVNRNRITQARTIQHVPRYLMESSLLDETINSVVAGLSTAVYIRPLTPRTGTTRRRRIVRRRRTKSKKPRSKTSAGAKSTSTGKGTRRRKRRFKKRRSMKKLQVKKDPTSRSRIAKNLGIGKPVRGVSIPSVYRPVDPSLGSMRADIGAASLSVYGDPFDLDPFDDGNDNTERSSSPMSLVEVKRKGLSRSALRSHQPVARPISVGLPRRGFSIPEAEVIAEAAPVPDLLGSILSGQSILMMDSADVVINRDGSLKAIKPVAISSKTSVSSDCNTHSATEIHAGTSSCPHTSAFILNGDFESSSPSSSSSSSSHTVTARLPSLNPLGPTVSHSSPVTLKSSNQVPLSLDVRPTTSGATTVRPHLSVLPRPNALASLAGNSSKISGSTASVPHVQFSKKRTDSNSDSRFKSATAPVKKAPPKPVWVDVSELPRIPKIKRENPSNSCSSDSRNSGIPDSCMNSLTGNGGRQQSKDHGTLRSEQSGERQRHCHGGSSSTSGSSITSPTGPSPSTVSFRISASGNSWHARRLAHGGAFSNPLKSTDDKSWQKYAKVKQTLSSQSKKKEEPIKSEIYDPFDPTGSDSSSSESPSDIFQSTNVGSESESMSHCVQDAARKEQESQSSSWDCFEEDIKDVGHHINVEKPLHCTQEKDVEGGSSLDEQKELICTKDLLAHGDSLQNTCKTESTVGEPLSSEEQGTSTSKRIDLSENELNTLPQKNACSRSSSTSSSHSEKKIKVEKKLEPKERTQRSDSTSGSGSRSATDKKVSSAAGGRRTSDEHGRSSSSEAARMKAARIKSREKKPPRSRSRERKRSRSRSRSSSSELSERWKRKKRRSRSKDRGRSHSSSLERAKKKKLKKERSHERHESKGSMQRPKDKKHRHSRSRSRSRERRKDRSRSRSTSGSKEVGNRWGSKERRRPGSRSGSREKKNEVHGQTSQSVEKKGAKDSKKPIKLSIASFKDHQQAKEKSPPVVSVKEEPGSTNAGTEPGLKNGRKKNDEKITESKMDIILEAKIKTEPTWLEESSCEDQVLVTVKEEAVSAIATVGEKHCESKLAGASPGNPPGDAFQETESILKVEDSDEEINVDYILDSLDLIKSEEPEPTKVSESAGDLNKSVKQEDAPVKQEAEPFAAVTVTSKSKAPVKRVTWKLQEADLPSSGKTGDVSSYKLQQSSKDGSWKPRDPIQNQDFSQSAPLVALVGVGSPSYGPVSEPTAQYILQGNLATAVATAGSQNFPPGSEPKTAVPDLRPQTQAAGQEDLKISDGIHDVDRLQNDKYMMKLHMQERAVEEVKLAIKPFYQKREITKEEYKDILRKAVQKVCHSKSGEINPVKVANLVRAYVDKYKHARKHKSEPEGSNKEAVRTKDLAKS